MPFSAAARTAIENDRLRLETALTGGDDYEILCTAPGDVAGRIERLSRLSGVPITAIGRMSEVPSEKRERVILRDDSGQPMRISQEGWRHCPALPRGPWRPPVLPSSAERSPRAPAAPQMIWLRISKPLATRLGDLHEHLVQMPSPLRPGAQTLGAFLANFGCEYRAEPVPPESHRLVTDIDAALVQEIFHIPQRQRETGIQHHRQVDDFPTGFKVLERITFRHQRTLPSPQAGHKLDCSDITSRDVRSRSRLKPMLTGA